MSRKKRSCSARSDRLEAAWAEAGQAAQVRTAGCRRRLRPQRSPAPPSLTLASYFLGFVRPSSLALALPTPRGSSLRGGVGWEVSGSSGHPSGIPFLALAAERPFTPRAAGKATINLNFICFVKADRTSTLAEAQQRRFSVAVALGLATFPPCWPSSAGFSQRAAAGYPADLGHPRSLPAKPDSLGKASPGLAACDTGRGLTDLHRRRVSPALLSAKKPPLLHLLPSLAGAEHPEFTPWGQMRSENLRSRHGRLPRAPAWLLPTSWPRAPQCRLCSPSRVKNAAFVSSPQPQLVAGAPACSSRPPSASRNAAQLRPAAAAA